MRKILASWAGKGAKIISKIHKSGGSALPGLVVEKIYPDFLSETLKNIPIVVISGTNGKTTTTKIVAELLSDYDLKVFTNPTGSNFTRGIASAMLDNMSGGKFSFDIAVLELDEAHAVHFVKKVKPTYSLLLNVLRDQMDRFGEIDNTASFLKTIAKHTTGTVILNRDDPLLNRFEVKNKKYFGYSPNIAALFPNDNRDSYKTENNTKKPQANISLENVVNNKAVFNIGAAKLSLSGAYNALNATAALTLVQTIMGEKFESKKSLARLEKIQPAFGRGEKLIINGKTLEIILVKNPNGFQSALANKKDNQATMVAINDEHADGRDVSWLWDVDFSALDQVAVVSGARAYDTALRLKYEKISIGLVETDLKKALNHFLATNQSSKSLQIYCTYTAMLKLRKFLALTTKVEKIL